MFSSFKRFERGWKFLICQKGKNFKQSEVTKWRKIRHKNLSKHSDLLWKRDIGEDSARGLPENFYEASSALNIRRLPRRLPSKSVSDLKNMHI